MAPGYIAVQWEVPRVAIPGEGSYQLDGRYFLLGVSHSEGELNISQTYIQHQ